MQAKAQQTIAENVYKHTLMLIEALKQNYIQYSIRGHQRSLERLVGNTETGIAYHQRCIDELKNGICPIDYVIESGKKVSQSYLC